MTLSLLRTARLTPLAALLALAACAVVDYKTYPGAPEGFAKAQPILDKLEAYKARRQLYPIALSDIGELGQDFYYQPQLGGDSYVLSFDYPHLTMSVRCTRTREKDWECKRK